MRNAGGGKGSGRGRFAMFILKRESWAIHREREGAITMFVAPLIGRKLIVYPALEWGGQRHFKA